MVAKVLISSTRTIINNLFFILSLLVDHNSDAKVRKRIGYAKIFGTYFMNMAERMDF
jgi:hypothetical protein